MFENPIYVFDILDEELVLFFYPDSAAGIFPFLALVLSPSLGAGGSEVVLGGGVGLAVAGELQGRAADFVAARRRFDDVVKPRK